MNSEFLAKMETNSWHRVGRLFFLPSSLDHMLESQEASELFFGLSDFSVFPFSICFLLALVHFMCLFFYTEFHDPHYIDSLPDLERTC